MPEYRNLGDALRGDRIAVEARRIDKVIVMKRTHGHKGQFTTLRDNAYCIIDKPLKAVLDKK
ncbi:MAG: hypothetical protein ISS58_05480 [Dehalococcoidales bacterium]|nr:hypothetical protein [Dehalococcoidales bacterium]